jgi:Gpi18-like mannosyltransferase
MVIYSGVAEMTDVARKSLKLDTQLDLWLDTRKFYWGLAIALVLHLILISLPIAFEIDMNLYKAWSIDIVKQGIGNFYGYSNCDYPPAFLYVLWAIGKIYQLFDPTFSHSDRSSIEGLLLAVMIKLPSVLADIGATFLIAQILKPHTTESKAYKLGLLYAFNPLVLFVSAVWGQIDGLMTFLMLLAFYLLQQNHLIRAGILTAVMVIIKPQGLFLVPFLIFSQWFRQAWWKWVAIASVSLVTIWLLVLPFYGIAANGIATPFLLLYQRLQGTADYYDFASVNAFNGWGWANWERDYETFLGVSYKVIGLVLLGILLVWLGVFIYQQRHSSDDSGNDSGNNSGSNLGNNFAANSLAAATMLFGFFMLPTRMHERYMLYSLAFLAIAIAIIPMIRWIYWGLTITGTVNMGYVYLRYNYDSLYSSIPEFWLQSLIYVTSAINVFLFVVLLSHTFRFRALSSASLKS